MKDFYIICKIKDLDDVKSYLTKNSKTNISNCWDTKDIKSCDDMLVFINAYYEWNYNYLSQYKLNKNTVIWKNFSRQKKLERILK